MTIGENIRKIRIDKGLTQRDLAAKLQITQQSIAQYENGKRIPKIYTVRKIADALQVNVNEIITDNWGLFSSSELSEKHTPTNKEIVKAIRAALSLADKKSKKTSALNDAEFSDASLELIRLAIKHAFEEVENQSKHKNNNATNPDNK